LKGHGASNMQKLHSAGAAVEVVV